jgi:hypothetical protein
MSRATGGQPVIVFLDYDGVVHYHDVRYFRGRGPVLEVPGRKLFEWAHIVDDALLPYPDARIVLSTSWVRELSFDRARRYLPASLQARVIGATFHSVLEREAPNWWRTSTRFQQIHAYVQRHNVRVWLAVDDLHSSEEIWPEEFEDHLVKSNSEMGLSDPATQERLRAVLKRLASQEGSPD